jgi:hypothetical protein
VAFRNRFDYGEGYFQVAEPTSDGFVFASATLSPTGTWPAREDAFSRCRSCFEVRTHRLCRRVLMFHHFQTELSVGDCLVRATQFTDQENAIATVLRGPTPSLVSHRALEIQGKPKLPPTAALKIIQLFFSIPTPPQPSALVQGGPACWTLTFNGALTGVADIILICTHSVPAR